MSLSSKSTPLKVLKSSDVGKLILKFISTKDGVKLYSDEIHVEAKNLLPVMKFLKKDVNFQLHILLDVCGADYPANKHRFEVVYHLLSVTKNYRLRVIVPIQDSEIIPSVSSLFKSANWYEREVWDLYGVKFSGHEDLRRILTDYGFQGHPLRKDFPLTGFKEVRYDAELQKVIYEDVYLTQEYRDFDTLSPYEGSKPNKLPGDEKATKE